jgi:alkylation response protein AidB-like acyl-CoA dehydrogenase
VLVSLTHDQENLRSTTARFLESQTPVNVLRELRDDPRGYPDGYWTRGADLGWAALLVGEEHGGGSVSGHPIEDLGLIAYEFGTHAAPGPLVPVNIVASALAPDSERHGEALEALMSGAVTAAWCYAEPAPNDGFGTIELSIEPDGSEVVINGIKRPVEGGADAAYLLVTGRTGQTKTQVLVAADTPGVTIKRLKSADLTRRFASVQFDNVRVPADAVVGGIGQADAQVARQVLTAIVLHNAETIGAMQRAFEMTLAYAGDRYSFGRPVASYQAIKHRFADQMTWLEGSHAINDQAITALDAELSESEELVHAAAGFIGQYGGELLQDSVQIHGGIGVTFEHDLHLYLRRVTVNRATFGTPQEHQRAVGWLATHRKAAQ